MTEELTAQRKFEMLCLAHQGTFEHVGISDLEDPDSSPFSIRYLSEIRTYYTDGYNPYSQEVTDEEVASRVDSMLERFDETRDDDQRLALTRVATWAFLDSQGRREELERRLDEAEGIK